jgi:leucyl aminopeptidase
LPDAGAAGINADGLIAVLTADGDLTRLGAPLDTALADALKGGDLERKACKALYLPRVAGVKAGRVVFSVARDASPKAFKTAVANGFAAVKAGPAKHVAVHRRPTPLSAAQRRGDRHRGEAEERIPLLRTTEAQRGALRRLLVQGSRTVVAEGAAVGPARSGRASAVRARPSSAGMALARECANLPAELRRSPTLPRRDRR